jgi:methylated-DNA-[protein]-cysteine S-methyltransferase
MYYSTHYSSPIGPLMLASDDKNIVGLWMERQKYFGDTLPEEPTEKNDVPVLSAAKKWLDRYFDGKRPAISELPLAPIGGEFRQGVWSILCEIPYGEVTTYGEIAKKIAIRMNKQKMSAQAVGGAVGHNPISIIIPCHRVVGTGGSLTGYSGGVNKKLKLLEFEGVDISGLSIPTKGTAL